MLFLLFVTIVRNPYLIGIGVITPVHCYDGSSVLLDPTCVLCLTWFDTVLSYAVW